MAKRFLALIGVFCALVACFVIPVGAYQVTFPSVDYKCVQYTYELWLGGDGVGYFTSPPTIGEDTYISYADPFGVFITDNELNPQPYPTEGTLIISLTQPVAFPLNTTSLSTLGDRLDISGDFEAVAEYAVVLDDNSLVTGTYEYYDGELPYPDAYSPYDGVSHVRDYLNHRYPTGKSAVVTSLTIELMEYMNSDSVFQYYVPNTIYTPVHPDDVNIQNMMFDGDVGAGELLLSPLEAFFGFEIFPNFSIGDIFGVIIAILLFVVILKLFAGG